MHTFSLIKLSKDENEWIITPFCHIADRYTLVFCHETENFKYHKPSKYTGATVCHSKQNRIPTIHTIHIIFNDLVLKFMVQIHVDIWIVVVIPLSHYRRYVPWLEVFLGGLTASRSTHFVWVVHTTGGQSLIGQGLLTVNNSWKTVLQMLVTEKQPQLTFGSHRTNTWQNDQYLNSPNVTMLHWKTSLCRPWTTPLVTIVSNSYAHAGNYLRMPTVSNSEAGILKSLKPTVCHWLARSHSDVRRWCKDRDVSPNTGYHGWYRC